MTVNNSDQECHASNQNGAEAETDAIGTQTTEYESQPRIGSLHGGFHQQKQTVFLDATIVVQAGKPPGGASFKHLIALVNSGAMEVVATDLTKQEIAKKYMQNDYEVVGIVRRPHFRELLSAVLEVDVPDLTHQQVQHVLLTKRLKDVDSMFAALHAKTLSIDVVPPSEIFNDYIASRGFFAPNVKKNQFGDAFIFAALQKMIPGECSLIVVSDDGDFEKVIGPEHQVRLCKSLEELFAYFGLTIDNLEPIEAFLEANHDQIQDAIRDELTGWQFEALDVEDAEIDISGVTSFVAKDLVGFRKLENDGPALIMGTANADLCVQFEHPDWDGALYDKEDDQLYTFDVVLGETNLDVALNFAIELHVSEQGEPMSIGTVNILNPRFIYVDLYQDDYPYK